MQLSRLGRTVEILLALAAFATVAIALLATLEFTRQATITQDWLLQIAPLAFLALVLMGSVTILGVRLAFPQLRPEGRIIAPRGIAGYIVVSLCLFAIAWWRDARFPPQAWAFVAGGVIGLVAFFLGRIR